MHSAEREKNLVTLLPPIAKEAGCNDGCGAQLPPVVKDEIESEPVDWSLVYASNNNRNADAAFLCTACQFCCELAIC